MSAEPVATHHCACCVHNPESPDVQNLPKRIDPTTISPAARVFFHQVDPEALADLMRWYTGVKPPAWFAKAKRASRLPKLTVELVAHHDGIEIVVKEVKIRAYRRRNKR